MIVFTVLYPYQDGARFDAAYYRDKHMPMIAKKLGDACKGYTVDSGLSGGAPGSKPPFLALCRVFFDSLAGFQAGMAEHGKAIADDVPNYTDIKPVVLISELTEDTL